MAKKKKQKAAGKKKATGKKKAATKMRASARPKARGVKARRGTKPRRAKKAVRARRAPQPEMTSGGARSSLGSGSFETAAPPPERGLGEEAGGQAGDVQGLSRAENVDSESVEELVEEGQGFEADAVSGVENAPDADQGEVRVHGRLEDELPPENPEDR